MAISTYSELKTAVQDWMDRTDISGNVADFISLAEATFNRELKMVETDVTLTGTIGSRAIDISSYDIIEPDALWLVDPNQTQEVKLVEQPDGHFPYYSANGYPTIWAIDGDYINFDSPLDTAYTFRFRYVGKFALSDSATTNKLLTDHPDIYLCGSIVWGSMFVEDDARIQKFAGMLTGFMSQAKHKIAQSRRGTVQMDPALSIGGSRNMGNYQW